MRDFPVSSDGPEPSRRAFAWPRPRPISGRIKMDSHMVSPQKVIAVVAGLVAAAAAIPAQAQAQRVPNSPVEVQLSYAPIVKRVTPAVVTVSAAKIVENRNPLMDDPFFRRFFGPQFGGGPREQT